MEQQPPISTGTVLAGFIVWLAQQGIDPDKRRRCPAIIEQFLRWQHQQRDQQKPGGFDTYRGLLAQQGATAAQIAEAEHACQLLERYLRSAC
jgi:hypothetical protein